MFVCVYISFFFVAIRCNSHTMQHIANHFCSHVLRSLDGGVGDGRGRKRGGTPFFIILEILNMHSRIVETFFVQFQE